MSNIGYAAAGEEDADESEGKEEMEAVGEEVDASFMSTSMTCRPRVEVNVRLAAGVTVSWSSSNLRLKDIGRGSK
jgi:hypothetical protein